VSARRSRRDRRGSRRRLRKGIYILPSLFTVGNMFCGFFSMVETLRGNLETAAVLIIVATFADLLDGRIARMTNTVTAFGKEYDSLADVVSFGIAPALLIFQWGLWQKPRLGLAVAFLFLVAGSIRLARFNIQPSQETEFSGLPIPGGANALALLVLVSPEPVVHSAFLPVVVVFVLGVATLMVSTLPYPSFKRIDLKKRQPTTALFFIALFFSLLAFAPKYVLASLLTVYILSAPFQVLRGMIRKSSGPETEGAAPADPPAATPQRTEVPVDEDRPD